MGILYIRFFGASDCGIYKLLMICENNWIRRIAGVKIVERRRTKDLREEVGTKACMIGEIVKNRMKWAGPMVKMKDERLLKRSGTKK